MPQVKDSTLRRTVAKQTDAQSAFAQAVKVRFARPFHVRLSFHNRLTWQVEDEVTIDGVRHLVVSSKVTLTVPASLMKKVGW